MIEDEESCFRAVSARDPRFDGWFVLGVVTTGIYCRPSCPATTPRRSNATFFASAAAAQGAGFRACKRCRPDAVPGSPEWRVRGDVAARAMRLIADGVVDREGVVGLARRLGYSPRQLQRILTAEVGAGPLALARAQRAQTARTLIETTELAMSEVAFAAGFSSLRQFHDTVRAVFACTPTELRRVGRARRRHLVATAGAIPLRLAVRTPFAADDLVAFLAARAVPGMEAVEHGTLRRALRLPHGAAVVRVAPGEDAVHLTVALDDLRDLAAAVARVRRLCDADADPRAVDAVLGADEVVGPSVRRRPGLRTVGSPDPEETALRIVLGQQITVGAARTATARLAERWGTTVGSGAAALRLLPTSAELAGVDPGELPLPRARGRALVGLATALADGSLCLDAGADRDAARARLLALAGVGPWTADVVVMRCLGDPDVVVHGDAGVRGGLALAGHGPDDLDELARRWRPWASYAIHHLWAEAAASSSARGGSRP